MHDKPAPSTTQASPLEKRLDAAVWDEMVGQMTSGFVHDLNNALTGLSSLVDLCLLEMTEEHPLHTNLVMARDQARQAATLLLKLGHLMQDRPRGTTVHDLRTVMEETADLIRPALPKRIRLEVRSGHDPLPVALDPHDVRKVLCQLVLNAVHAIPRGTATLTLHAGQADPNCTRDSVLAGLPPRNDMVLFSVRDDGPGVDDQVLQDVFDIHATTRPSRFGLGLGLAMVARLAEAWGGGAAVKSKRGEGCQVSVWLPKAGLKETFPESKTQGRVLLTGEMPEWVGQVEVWLRDGGWQVERVLEAPARWLARQESPCLALVLFCGKNFDANSLHVWQPFRRVHPPLRLIQVVAAGPDTAMVAAGKNLVDRQVSGLDQFIEVWTDLWALR